MGFLYLFARIFFFINLPLAAWESWREAKEVVRDIETKSEAATRESARPLYSRR
jgi:hypothetical protein